MCNDYEQHIAWAAYCKAMDEIALARPGWQGEMDLPQADHIRIRDLAPIVVLNDESEAELRPMRWAFPPDTPGRGAPVFNFRSEGRSFVSSRRCLIPASAFFEFTGTKTPKTRHRFTSTTDPFMCIAGLWRPAEGNDPPNFTMLTTSPGPDVAPIHNRQVVVLPQCDWSAWLRLSKPEGDLLRPSPAQALVVGGDAPT